MREFQGEFHSIILRKVIIKIKSKLTIMKNNGNKNAWRGKGEFKILTVCFLFQMVAHSQKENAPTVALD